MTGTAPSSLLLCRLGGEAKRRDRLVVKLGGESRVKVRLNR